MFRLSLLLFSCIFFVSCSHVSRIRTSDNLTIFPETNSSKIGVYSTSDCGKQYIVIGEVMAAYDAGENSSKPIRLLKEQASMIGADAIVNVRLSFSSGYWANGIIASGTAVKFK
jgi:hypothetical protein